MTSSRLRDWLAHTYFIILLAFGGLLSQPMAGESADAQENPLREQDPVTSSETDEALAANGNAPQQRRQRGSGRVYKSRITPHWSDDNRYFWYQNELPENHREYILVDVVQKVRKKAFDHKRLAEALKEAEVANVTAERLSLTGLKFKPADNTMTFRTAGKDWRCHLETYELMRIEDRSPPREKSSKLLHPKDGPRASPRTGAETELVFQNRTTNTVELIWLDSSGRKHSYGRINAGDNQTQHTFAGHAWLILGRNGEELAIIQAEEQPDTVTITGRPQQRSRDRGPRRGPARGPGRDTSPDGNWRAFVRDANVFVQKIKGEEEAIQLSQNGENENAYDLLQWAPDSKTLVAFRVVQGERKEVYLVESSPREGGRAKLRSRPYMLPGDKYSTYELNLFSIADKKQTKPEVERIDFGRPRLRWNSDGRRFTYWKTDRGHQRFRVIEVDSHSGQARNIIDEQTDTFIWTAHAANLGVQTVTWLDKTDELVYISERDGWRHLYLIDPETGQIKNQITKGEFVVRRVDQIDEEKRQIWFRASGKFTDQDPYLIHYFRVNFDGSGLVALTEGHGNHSLQYSPDHQFIIDTYSRVDMAPVHELRSVADGKLVCELEKADVGQLRSQGWEQPEVFSAKGRDGKTDIWGFICRPRDFDPTKKYPVIEAIYAGPHGSHVPKTFSASRRFANLTDLGFVVAKIDGMGTANRSKAFHDVCWKNLKDAGFPDRILWHKAVAKKYSWYDVSRVGIYGGSAGGQNSTGALLFYPDFYDVAVSSCGCHDNRMDKASWNEQWMGYPVGPQYSASSNIDNAHRLRGKLMLIVGELDTNVPPESTMRLADALIKADKDFELVVIPGGGHGDGGRYGERRRQDFFIRNLLGTETPDRNAPRPPNKNTQ